MKKWSGCPWYIWVFSFFSLFVLTVITMFRVWLALIQRKVSFDLWLKFVGEFFLDWGILFMLSVMLLSLLIEYFAPGLWVNLGLPIAYALGIFPAVRMYRWRKSHL